MNETTPTSSCAYTFVMRGMVHVITDGCLEPLYHSREQCLWAEL